MNIDMHSSNQGKIYAFDYLRAIFSIIVVGLHTNVLGFLIDINHKNLYNILWNNVFLFAVPVFFQLALILFFIKREKQKDYFLNKRFFKILKLYIFWGTVSQIYNLAINQTFSISLVNNLYLINIVKIVIYLMKDGYSNPFYFFFSLLFLTSLAELFAFGVERSKIDKYLLCYSGLLLSCIALFLFPLSVIFISHEFDFLTQFFNPLNFTPYIFSSFLIVQKIHKKQNNKNHILINHLDILMLTILFILFVCYEWSYLNYPVIWGGLMNNDPLPLYSRLSLVFGTWLITLILIQTASEPHFVIKLFSDLSLGIYCLHSFFVQTMLYYIHKVFPQAISGCCLSNPVNNIVIFLLAILFSILLTIFLRKFKQLEDII